MTLATGVREGMGDGVGVTVADGVGERASTGVPTCRASPLKRQGDVSSKKNMYLEPGLKLTEN